LLGLRPAWREETEGQAAEWRLEAAARGAPAVKGGLCARGRGWGPVGGKVSAVKSRRRVGLNVRDRGRERENYFVASSVIRICVSVNRRTYPVAPRKPCRVG
jgi:hypothetical protein